ncbi:MAG: ATP--cob(I)alamin adenosyltransferase [Chloroflexota bacterium]
MSPAHVYTRSGDDGQTGLFGGPRVAKDDSRLDAYGTVDELNAVIGVAVAAVQDADLPRWLRIVQSDLFDIGGELATPGIEERIRGGQPVGPRVTDEDVAKLEGWIDTLDEEIEPLQHFILPGGTPAAGYLHHALTVCRRAERRVLTFARDEDVSPAVVRYLNRLSDALFTMARAVNARTGITEPQWLGRNERSAT